MRRWVGSQGLVLLSVRSARDKGLGTREKASGNRSTGQRRVLADGLDFEDIEAPGSLIDVEPAACKIVAVALIDFVVDHVREAKAPAAQFRKRQDQVALAASGGVVHDDDV